MEETKKRRGRPPKKVENRGGKREGAGRKKGACTIYEGEALTAQLTLRVRAITSQRIKQLRELTKDDTMPFNRMLEAWVEELAQDYGLE